MLRLEELGVLVRRAPQARVQIVTDSTADLPADLARAHGIAVVPLTVAFGKEVFRDRIDLQPGQFYLCSRSARSIRRRARRRARTSRRATGSGLRSGSEVVSLHLSAKLSKTFENARAAAARPAAALDTGQVSLGLGLLALFAARLAARDEPAERIVRRLREMAPRVHTLFVVDTLELPRPRRPDRQGPRPPGRSPARQADPRRGGRRGRPRSIRCAAGAPPSRGSSSSCASASIRKRPVIAGICHANAPAWADSLERLVREQLQIAELIEAEVGPVIGANVGPGALAITVFQPTGDELRWIAPLWSKDARTARTSYGRLILFQGGPMSSPTSYDIELFPTPANPTPSGTSASVSPAAAPAPSPRRWARSAA